MEKTLPPKNTAKTITKASVMAGCLFTTPIAIEAM
jgi:hypothetical protein